jgi:hypothetical protein
MVVQIGELYPIGSRTRALTASFFGEGQVTEGTKTMSPKTRFHRGACANKRE